MAVSIGEVIAALTTTTALLVTAALVAFIVVRSRVVQGRAEARYPPEGDILDVDGVRLHVVQKGRGPAVLLLHGLNGFIQDWLGPGILDDLAEDHRVIALDRPGYGHSSRPRPGLSDPRLQADLLAGLLDALDVEDVLVVGHSWGGALAMALAAQHPERVRGLVLVAPYVYPGTEPNDVFHRLPRLPFLRNVITHLFMVPVGQLVGRWFVNMSFDPEPVPEDYSDLWHALSLRRRHFDTTIEEIRTIDPALFELVQRYGELHVPITIIAGDGDRSVNAELNARRLATVVDHAELVLLEDVGHMVLYTRPGLILDAVRSVGKQSRADDTGADVDPS